MKKALSVLTALAVLMCCMPALAGAEAAFTEETTEYRDEIISFRYPAKWTCGVAYDGSIILGITGTQSAVSVAALISDMVSYTGDREAASDCGQDTMVRIWRGLGSWRGENAFESWVFRVAAN